VTAAATLMFGLSAALILLGLEVLPKPLLLSGIGLDLVLFGVAVAVADAFDEGEAVRTDMVCSLVVSFATAVVFGAQVAVSRRFRRWRVVPRHATGRQPDPRRRAGVRQPAVGGRQRAHRRGFFFPAVTTVGTVVVTAGGRGTAGARLAPRGMTRSGGQARA
jgi:hypothetical protein